MVKQITFTYYISEMLSEKEIKLIKKSWSALHRVNPVLIGDVFYRKLFIDVPELKKMFTSSPEAQAKKLIDMLNVIVARLERFDELSQDIKQLGLRHVRYGVTDKHYEYVGAALIWTLKQALRNEWNAKTEDAWIKCYTLLADAMIRATKE